MSLPVRKTFTRREYFALEGASDTRYEYLDGEIVAMSGASLAHNRIVLDTAGSLNNQLRERGCEVFVTDTRVKLDARNYVYPDIAVVCGQLMAVVEGGLETLLDPTLLIEVLSPSTEAYDRGEKFKRYQALASLREYILIAQDAPRIEVYTRQADDAWRYAVAVGMEAAAALSSVGVTLTLSEVYRRVTFEA
ncbi:MAG: Uma2 family endonuclease [Anaerolineae bacterium]|nr:Uma2 family endonuclease [Anaerolineae bacterium]NUQ06776.1 Uma2 family endonuclease [Anaerolineae bacterium]